MDNTPVDFAKLKEYSLIEVQRHDGGRKIAELKQQYDQEQDVEKKQDILDDIGLYSDRAWIIIHGLIIDVSEFRDRHPAGRYVIDNVVGGDATEDFESTFHSLRARSLLRPLIVGKLRGYNGDITRALRRR